jgi:ABC-type bacteriocin/lantibiotic exporter with double-glycine peptidase domain
MKHVKQRGTGDCVIACIAMVSGEPYEKVLERHNINKDLPAYETVMSVSSEEELQLLLQYGIKFNLLGYSPYLLVGNIYILSVPSPSDPFNLAHRIVLSTEQNELTLYDPLESEPITLPKPFIKVFYDAIQIVR